MAAADADPVSFTDTNAETLAGGKNATSSQMMDIIGDLKKKKKAEEKESSEDKSSGDKKKKKKKKKKGKSKKKRGVDRYEPQNYLMRIEGSICCAAIFMLIGFLVANLIVLIVVMIVSEMNLRHTFNDKENQAPPPPDTP